MARVRVWNLTPPLSRQNRERAREGGKEGERSGATFRLIREESISQEGWRAGGRRRREGEGEGVGGSTQMVAYFMEEAAVVCGVGGVGLWPRICRFKMPSQCPQLTHTERAV